MWVDNSLNTDCACINTNCATFQHELYHVLTRFECPHRVNIVRRFVDIVRCFVDIVRCFVDIVRCFVNIVTSLFRCNLRKGGMSCSETRVYG